MSDKTKTEKDNKMREEMADQYFAELAASREKIEESKKVFFCMMDLAVRENRRDIFENLIFYIMKGDGQYALHHFGETNRILNMCQIISLEYKHGERLFYDGCDGYESLKEKYFLTMYALRRILFTLSEESVEVAKTYLHNSAPSYLAVHIILQRELFRVDEDFIMRIKDTFRNIWTLEQLKNFVRLRGMEDE